MGTTRETLREWFSEAKANGATHMIVVCDTFDYTDYPVFVKPTENVRTVEAERNAKSMSRVMEVYNTALDIDEQLQQRRAFNY